MHVRLHPRVKINHRLGFFIEAFRLQNRIMDAPDLRFFLLTRPIFRKVLKIIIYQPTTISRLKSKLTCLLGSSFERPLNRSASNSEPDSSLQGVANSILGRLFAEMLSVIKEDDF